MIFVVKNFTVNEKKNICQVGIRISIFYSAINLVWNFINKMYSCDETRLTKANTYSPSGFHAEDTTNKDHYGTSLNIYKWSTHELQQVIDLGPEGCAPLEIRFLHDPKSAQGFVGCALEANVYRYEIYRDFCYCNLVKVLNVGFLLVLPILFTVKHF